MENKRCNSCGGELSRNGNYYCCEFCGNRWEVDASNDIHAVDRANAWSALRDNDFEKSADLFEQIIAKEATNHEAYWGRALALHGITYVTDLNENKKVPTCNNITEKSFIQHKDVQKAISLASADIAEGYQKQAEYIEKVRLEWLQKASKEPAYDVFISFKDSDRENGIERTQDSIDAQDLYNALVAEGYKVFFSRISLRDKISEQYEPYIYNAIKTAKVMVVFGEKAEYFSSVWIKNEWSRFKSRIEKGEKHKNSLVVVYKNINPSDLPAVLRTRQCLNAADMTFLSDLTRHIKRVVEESKRNVKLEKIEIAGGQIAKKASAISINSVQTREIGAGVAAETSITEKQTISLAFTYMEANQWEDATNLLEDVLFNNPSCAEAIWCKLLATYQVSTNNQLLSKLDNFKQSDYLMVEKVLNCASQEFAKEILLLLYASEIKVSSITYKKVLETILPFSFRTRQREIDKAFDGVIARSKYAPFNLLLKTLKTTDVDKYISYNYTYAVTTKNPSEKKECLANILAVDEGHVGALRTRVYHSLESNRSAQKIISHFESLLKYTTETQKEVLDCLDWLCQHLKNKDHCTFLQQLLRYFSGELSSLKIPLLTLCNRMLENKLFAEVEYFLSLILSFDPNNVAAYWGICLMRVNAPNEEAVQHVSISLKAVPEFNRYLTLVNEFRRRECLELVKKQEQNIAQLVKKQEQDKARNDYRSLKKEAAGLIVEQTVTRAGGIIIAVSAVLTVILAFVLPFILGDSFLSFLLAFLIAMVTFISGMAIGRQFKTPSNSVVQENREKKRKLLLKMEELKSKYHIDD